MRNHRSPLPSDPDDALEELRRTISTPRAWGMAERLVPDSLRSDPFSDYIKEVQVRNYRIASRFAQGKRVLDIACGSGYGSSLLVEGGASEVIGVDVNSTAIRYASLRYPSPVVRYIVSDAMAYNDAGKFDLIVSFETIEHLQSPLLFMHKLSTLIADNGLLVLSAPVGETRHIDPYHLHRFSMGDIHDLLRAASFDILLTRQDPFRLSLRDVFSLAKSYPEASPSNWAGLLYSRRAWWLLAKLLGQGGLHFSQYLVVADRLGGAFSARALR